jgi:CheY-like chemotaxis protein
MVGFQVREATDGQQGVEMWEQWQPHLIWMDMRMPVLDGYEATRRIKDMPGGNETKILALTASAFEEDRRKVLAAGCDDFVRKPFQEAEFFDKMAEHLGLSFVYEKEEQREELGPMDVDWSVLPSEWLQAVHRAAEVADSEELEELVEQIRTEHPDVAKALTRLVYNFSFDQVVALVKGARA